MPKVSRRFRTSIFFLVVINSLLLSQGYSIKLDAKDFAGKEVILAEYFTSRMVPKDTLVLNAMGSGTFRSDTPLDGGLYLLFFSPRHYLDFMLDKDQELSVRTDSIDFTFRTEFEGSKDNELFYGYKRHLAGNRILQQRLSEKLGTASGTEDSLRVKDSLDSLNIAMQDYIDASIDANRGTFFATFLQAMKETRAPEELLTGSQREKDSLRYVYYKDHYFDNFDISDLRLLHTPLYEPKVKTYINSVVPQHPDSIIAAADRLIEKSRADEAIFRYMLITLFNNYAESKLMGMDKVYFHIAEKYYIPEATWSSKEFVDKLRENLKKSKPTFIGNIAPDFELRGIPAEHFQLADMDTAIKNDPHVGFSFSLSQVESAYTLLYFWEADCGHCQKSTPELYNVFEKYKDQGVQVVSVHVINSVEGKVKWVDFVNKHEMYGWINCWSPYNNDFRTVYNLLSFPQLFLLDKDKKIIAKTITPEQADDILNRFLND